MGFNNKKTFVEKLAIGIIMFTIVSIILTILGQVFITVWALNNPESIGDWFGKLIGGFKE